VKEVYLMDYELLDLLDKVIDDDLEADKELLIKDGVLTVDGQIVRTKINLMTGAFVSTLVDAIIEADMNPQRVLVYLNELRQQYQHIGIYYFLLCLFRALEVEIPYLFILMPRHIEALKNYIDEVLEDMKDCLSDLEA
jgi:hypothetical protein